MYSRWGRVGESGITACDPCGLSLNTAKRMFEKKFLDKTKNKWKERANFQPVSTKYILERHHSDEGDAEKKPLTDNASLPAT